MQRLEHSTNTIIRNLYQSWIVRCDILSSWIKSFKRAAIVPVFKTGDKAKPSYYRPISLTSTICEILERIIRKQVFTYLSDNELFNETQHGFRGGRSCLSALLDVFDNIMNMLGKDP